MNKMRLLKYCPSCRSENILFDDIKKHSCKDCSFTFFQNVATAVAAVLEYDQKILLIKRNNEPGKGKLDLPGGFVDPKESAEEAVKREIKEELKINLDTLKYFGSFPNIYEYEDILYNTCDLFFYSRIQAPPTDVDRTEIEELIFINPMEIPFEKIAFESTKVCLKLFPNIQRSM